MHLSITSFANAFRLCNAAGFQLASEEEQIQIRSFNTRLATRINVASYPGLLTPTFVTFSTNAGEGLVKLITCNEVPGRVEEWHIPGKNASK